MGDKLFYKDIFNMQPHELLPTVWQSSSQAKKELAYSIAEVQHFAMSLTAHK